MPNLSGSEETLDAAMEAEGQGIDSEQADQSVTEGTPQETAPEAPATFTADERAEYDKLKNEVAMHRKQQPDNQMLREWLKTVPGGMDSIRQQVGRPQTPQPTDDDAFFAQTFANRNAFEQYMDARVQQTAQSIVQANTFQQQQKQANDYVVTTLDQANLPFVRKQEIYLTADQIARATGLQEAVNYVHNMVKASVAPQVAAQLLQQQGATAAEIATKNAEERSAKLRQQAQPQSTSGGGPGPSASPEKALVGEIMDIIKKDGLLERAMEAK